VRDPTTNLVSTILTKSINVDGEWITNGIDFGAMLTFHGGQFDGSEDDWGRISLGAQGTYTMTFDIPRHQAANRTITTATTPTVMTMALPPAGCDNSGVDVSDMDLTNNGNPTDSCDVTGNRNANNAALPVPVWRVNFPLVYTIHGHSATAIGHYTSGLDDDVEPNLDGSFDEIPGYFTLDLQYGYTLEEIIGEKLTLRVGMYNVLDQEPPRVNGLASAFEPGVHDPRGRMMYAKLSAEF
jgi:outer membrane receptor protein involved in Fe transport